MKHCYHCGRISVGDPLFCNACGRTFDRKLCPRLHPNPRSAEICSRCGSRELSSPQPHVSLGRRAGEWLVRMLAALLVLIVTIALASAVMQTILRTAAIQSMLVMLVLLVGVLWWLWSKLPHWVRKLIGKLFGRRKEKNGHE
jgi:hypothetical protein